MPEIFKDQTALKAAFDRQGYAMRRVLLTKSVKAGAEIIRQRAEELAPRDTGQLAESELVRVIGADSSAAEVVAKIGPDRKCFYGMFQEFGTAFMVAHPFLNPALEQSQDEALKVSAEIVGKGLERLV